MFATILGIVLFLPSIGPSLVIPGMTYAEVAALVAERPVILNRTQQNWVRVAEYPRARTTVTFDEGRVVAVTRW